MRRERKFRTNKVIPFLKTLRYVWSEPISQKSERGTPDFILCANGKFIGLELKDDGKEPDPIQEYKGKEIVRCGGIYIVAKPENWEAVKRLLVKLDQGEL